MLLQKRLHLIRLVAPSLSDHPRNCLVGNDRWSAKGHVVETTPARILFDIELLVQDLLNGWQSHCAMARLMHSLGFLPHGDIRVAGS